MDQKQDWKSVAKHHYITGSVLTYMRTLIMFSNIILNRHSNEEMLKATTSMLAQITRASNLIDLKTGKVVGYEEIKTKGAVRILSDAVPLVPGLESDLKMIEDKYGDN